MSNKTTGVDGRGLGRPRGSQSFFLSYFFPFEPLYTIFIVCDLQSCFYNVYVLRGNFIQRALHGLLHKFFPHKEFDSQAGENTLHWIHLSSRSDSFDRKALCQLSSTRKKLCRYLEKTQKKVRRTKKPKMRTTNLEKIHRNQQNFLQTK